MEEGEKSETGKYGANFGKGANFASYQYKTDKFPDGRANALGWMNYIVGYVKYFQLNRKDEAIPYFEKSTEYRSEVADFPETYTIIGDWNFGKFVELNEKSSNSGETGAEKQFAERAVVAYKKAYDLAKADSKADVLEKLKKLYALGFGKEEN